MHSNVLLTVPCQEEVHESDQYLSGGGLPPEELMVERAVGGVELGLQEDAAVGYGLQRRRAFVWEAKPDEELQEERKDGN